MARPKRHPYRKLVLPPNAPFELRPTPGKGWGAFATRPISTNEVVLLEPALFKTKCLDQITEDELVDIVSNLSSKQRAQVDILRKKGTGKNRETKTLLDTYSANNFTSGANANGDHEGHNFQILASRFNHSCTPNLIQHSCDCLRDTVRFLAVGPISVDTELTFGYSGNRMHECMTHAERHVALGTGWKMDCKCTVCSAEPEHRYHSDFRRRLIRGLYYLIFGTDIAQSMHPKLSPKLLVPKESSMRSDPDAGAMDCEELDLDGERAKAARKFRIPLSTRIVYCTLALALMEDEEVLDQYLIARLSWIMDEAYELLHSSTIRNELGLAILPLLQKAELRGRVWRPTFGWVKKGFGLIDPNDADGNLVLKKKLLAYRGELVGSDSDSGEDDGETSSEDDEESDEGSDDGIESCGPEEILRRFGW